MNFTTNNTAMTALEKCRKALPDASSVKSFLGRYKKILRIALAAVLLLAVVPLSALVLFAAFEELPVEAGTRPPR